MTAKTHPPTTPSRPSTRHITLTTSSRRSTRLTPPTTTSGQSTSLNLSTTPSCRSTRPNPSPPPYSRSTTRNLFPRINANLEPKKFKDGSLNSVPLTSGLRRSSRLSSGPWDFSSVKPCSRLSNEPKSPEFVEKSSNVAHKSINSAILGDGSSVRRSSRLSLPPKIHESVGNRGESLTPRRSSRSSLPPKSCQFLGNRGESLTLRRSSRPSIPPKPYEFVSNTVGFSTPRRSSRASLPPKSCQSLGNTGEFSTPRRSSRPSIPPKLYEFVSNTGAFSTPRRSSRASLPPKICQSLGNTIEFSTPRRSSRLSKPPKSCEFVNLSSNVAPKTHESVGNRGESLTPRRSSRPSLPPKNCQSVGNRGESLRRSSRPSLPPKPCEFVSNTVEFSTPRRSSRLSKPPKSCEFVNLSSNVAPKKVIVSKKLKKLVQRTSYKSMSTGVASDRGSGGVGVESTGNIMQKSRNVSVLTPNVTEPQQGGYACERNEAICVNKKRKLDEEGNDTVQGQEWTKGGSLTPRRSSRLSLPLKTCEFVSRSSNVVSKKVIVCKESKKFVHCTSDKSASTGVASDGGNVEVGGNSTGNTKSRNASVLTLKVNKTEKGEDACERNEGLCVNKKRKLDEEGNNTVQGQEWTREQESALQRAYILAKPTPQFWKKVSKLVPGKSAQDCFNKVHSDHMTPPQALPRSRVNKMKSTLPESFPLRASELINLTRNDIRKSSLNKRKSHLVQKSARELLLKHSHIDQDNGSDLFSVLESNTASCSSSPRAFQKNDILSTPMPKSLEKRLQQRNERFTSGQKKNISRFHTNPCKVALMSPPVLKQVKNRAVHNKYIDQLHKREAKRRSIHGKENRDINIDRSDVIRAAKDALVTDVRDVVTRIHQKQDNGMSDSSEFDEDESEC